MFNPDDYKYNSSYVDYDANSIVDFAGSFEDGTPYSKVDIGLNYGTVRINIPFEKLSNQGIDQLIDTHEVLIPHFKTIESIKKNKCSEFICKHEVMIYVENKYLSVAREGFYPFETDETILHFLELVRDIAPKYYFDHRKD